MSRVGKKPVIIPEGVKVNILTEKIEMKGPKGKLFSPLFPDITAELKDNQLILKRKSDAGNIPAIHGLARALAANAVQGVFVGFVKQLEIVGIGYRANLKKGKLELNLGFSKPVIYDIPDDIEIEMDKQTLITVKGISKQRVGQEAHKIRSFRKPDVYKLKGIRYVGEQLIKKERRAVVTGV